MKGGDESKVLKIIFFIGDLGFDLAAIVTAIIVVIHYKTQSPQPDVSELMKGVLGVLSLIAGTSLWDRFKRLRGIEEKVAKIHSLVEEQGTQRVRAEEFFRDTDGPTVDSFQAGMSIGFAGITLGNTTREFAYILGQRLVAGAHIRIMLVDTKPDVLEQIVRRSFGTTTTPDYYRTRLEGTADLIRIIANTPNAGGTLEIGHLPYVPSFGITIVDPTMPDGKAFVEIYHHNSSEPFPTFYLTPDWDPHWFRFFEKQYNLMWGQCRVEKILGS